MTAEADDETPEFGGKPTEPQFTEPENRGKAKRTELGTVEYIDDIVRPGRLVVIAAEEGTGKSYASKEMSLRLATHTGKFAETWEVKQRCKVLYISEMHTDDDYDAEERILEALGKTRDDIDGWFFRLSMFDAANGKPPLQVPEWLDHATQWTIDNDIKVLIFDTVTTAVAKPSFGTELMDLIAALRHVLTLNPALAIVLVVHMKKPSGRGDRGLSDVMGEYGRFNDVTILMENDGKGLQRLKLTARKRVREEKRLLLNKKDGLLVDPIDITKPGPRVDTNKQLEVITETHGMTLQEYADALGVSKSTATRYANKLGEAIVMRPVTIDNKKTYRLYPAEPAGAAL